MKRSVLVRSAWSICLVGRSDVRAERGIRIHGGCQVSQDSLDRIMSAWCNDIRANAEKLVAAYGLLGSVTSTILVWDVPIAAQQQAMIRAVGEHPQMRALR